MFYLLERETYITHYHYLGKDVLGTDSGNKAKSIFFKGHLIVLHPLCYDGVELLIIRVIRFKSLEESHKQDIRHNLVDDK